MKNTLGQLFYAAFKPTTSPVLGLPNSMRSVATCRGLLGGELVDASPHGVFLGHHHDSAKRLSSRRDAPVVAIGNGANRFGACVAYDTV